VPLGLLLARAEIRWPIRRRDRPARLLIDLPQMFQQHELGDDVAVAGGGNVDNLSGFFEPAGDAVQGVVGEIVWIRAALALKVVEQPAARFEVALAAGIGALVQPRKQPFERAASRDPVTFEFGGDACAPEEFGRIVPRTAYSLASDNACSIRRSGMNQINATATRIPSATAGHHHAVAIEAI